MLAHAGFTERSWGDTLSIRSARARGTAAYQQLVQVARRHFHQILCFGCGTRLLHSLSEVFLEFLLRRPCVWPRWRWRVRRQRHPRVVPAAHGAPVRRCVLLWPIAWLICALAHGAVAIALPVALGKGALRACASASLLPPAPFFPPPAAEPEHFGKQTWRVKQHTNPVALCSAVPHCR